MTKQVAQIVPGWGHAEREIGVRGRQGAKTPRTPNPHRILLASWRPTPRFEPV